MGFLRKLKKKLKGTIGKAAKLYGSVGGLVGAPGAGVAARFAPLLSGPRGAGVSHNSRAAARAQGIGHGRLNMIRAQQRVRAAPRYRYQRRRMVM